MELAIHLIILIYELFSMARFMMKGTSLFQLQN